MSAKQCKVVLALGQVASLLCHYPLLSLFPTHYVVQGEIISFRNQPQATVAIEFIYSLSVFSMQSPF